MRANAIFDTHVLHKTDLLNHTVFDMKYYSNCLQGPTVLSTFYLKFKLVLVDKTTSQTLNQRGFKKKKTPYGMYSF
jgi:hypothetical protein